MSFGNYRYNRIGGIDADKTLEGGEIVPYTLSEGEIDDMPENSEIADYIVPAPSELEIKLNAFEFNGVVCSVHKKDRDGWTNISLMLSEHITEGGVFNPFTFYMANGNTLKFNSLNEWNNFKKIGREVVFEFYSNKEG